MSNLQGFLWLILENLGEYMFWIHNGVLESLIKELSQQRIVIEPAFTSLASTLVLILQNAYRLALCKVRGSIHKEAPQHWQSTPLFFRRTVCDSLDVAFELLEHSGPSGFRRLVSAVHLCNFSQRRFRRSSYPIDHSSQELFERQKHFVCQEVLRTLLGLVAFSRNYYEQPRSGSIDGVMVTKTTRKPLTTPVRANTQIPLSMRIAHQIGDDFVRTFINRSKSNSTLTTTILWNMDFGFCTCTREQCGEQHSAHVLRQVVDEVSV
ncbi:hypothetical protein D7W82_15175 [Corallococcus sp. CA049B]|nr:hypothetical protein D7W82_15175 [Corallococcus sp. CA049B]